MAILGKFFGRSASEGAGFALGVVAAPALEPAVRTLVNTAWHAHPDMPIEAGLLAEGVASGEIPLAWAHDEAKRTGYNEARFDRLVEVVDTGPGVGQAFRLWRRRKIDEPGFRRALKRARLEPEWIEALVQTKQEPLDPAVIANAIQQGFLPADGILPDASGGSAPFTPPVEQVALDPTNEAEFSGVPSDHLRVLAQLSGNPPGPMQLLDMWNRGIITEEAVERGIREGRTKTKWIEPLKLLRRSILTGTQVVNLWIRGWITPAQAYALGADQGYDRDTLDLLYKGQGRPLSWHQTWIGIQRGGRYDGPTGDIDPAFESSLRQSNIRPEWYDLAWAQRYSYPSAFVMRALTQAGTLTAAQTEADLLDMGWRPDRAKQVATAWAGGADDTDTGAYVTTARSQLWTTTHRSYIAAEVNPTEARRKLGQAGVPVAERDGVIAVWTHERELIRKQLTPAQIKKAWVKVVVNRATGQPWTREEAVAALIERGYSPNDANEYLDIPPTRAAPTKALTASQIRQAFQERDANPATGVPWTQDEALAALGGLGYTPNDALTFLGLGEPVLTPKQIQDAVGDKTITREEGIARLLALGFRAEDAALLLPPPPPEPEPTP